MSEKYLMDSWPGENHLEDVITWGIQPLMTLNDVFDRYVFDENPELVFLHYEYKSKLQNLEKIIFRYDLYHMLLESRLKELAPDDALVVDPVGQVKAELQFREERMAAIEAERDENGQTVKRLHDVMDKHKLDGQVIHDVMDAVISEAERVEQRKDLKIKLLKQVNEMPENKVSEVYDFLKGLFMEQDAPQAEEQTIGA